MGRTCSGKTTITKEICKRMHLNLLKSYATREMRIDEDVHNADHIFINPDDVVKYKDKMIAHTTINGIEYFSTVDQLLKSDVYIIDPNGIDYLRTSKFPELNNIDFIEIYIRVPKSTIRRFAAQRGNDLEEFETRYKNESEQFDYYEKHQQFMYHVLNNGTLEEAVDKLEKIIRRELNDRRNL